MPEISYNYTNSDVVLYATNLYGGPDADLDDTPPVNDADGFTSDIDLTSKMYAVIDFKFDASGDTDDLVLKLYRRRDASWDGAERSIDEVKVPNDGSEAIYSFNIGLGHGPGHYRISMQSSGGTDTFDIEVKSRNANHISQ